MAEGTAEESSAILSALENGRSFGDGSLLEMVTSFLHPFGDFIALDSCNARKNDAGSKKKKSSCASSNEKITDGGDARVRPLAKKFLPFISRALKNLPSAIRKCRSEEEESAAELLSVYRLVLDCLCCVSPCLAGKPFSVHLQRCSLLYCLEVRGRFSEALDLGFSILESLVSALSVGVPEKCRGRKAKARSCDSLVPYCTGKDACDEELAILVVEIVVCLSRCAYKSCSETEILYRRILLMGKEVKPWLRYLAPEVSKKYHLALINALWKCSQFLGGECMSFDVALVHDFCLETCRECLSSPSMDQFPKMARQLCSSFSAQWDQRFLLVQGMLKCALDSITCKCKENVVYCVNEFLEFVLFIVDYFRTASAAIRRTAYVLVTEQRLNLLEVSPSVANIMGLYAVALSFGRTVFPIRREGISLTSKCALDVLPYESDDLQLLSDSLAMWALNSDKNEEEFSEAFSSCLRKFSSLHLEQNISCSCSFVHGSVSFFSFVDALGFVCNQLDEYVTVAWKDLISDGITLHSADRSYVCEALNGFCVMFLSKINDKFEKERLLENRLSFFHAVVSSVKFSFLTGKKLQKILLLINHVISSNWIKAQELKYLASSVYNIGASLHNAGQIEKAATALELCCSASWVHIKILCRDHTKIAECDHLSKCMIKDAAVDACVKSSVALDVIHKSGNKNLRSIAVDCLFSWSVMEESLETSSCPSALIKQWVKIVCRDFKDFDEEDSIPIMYRLLSHRHSSLSSRVSGIILEQELLAYEEFSSKLPNLFHRMQLKLMDVLLSEVYVSEKYVLHRSKILVKKGRSVRRCGINGLNNSFQCLSDAIVALVANVDTSTVNPKLSHQLGFTYFLRAHCAQEMNRKAEDILNDISCALCWWSRISEDDYRDLDYEKTVPLLLSITDLLTLKGHLRFQLEMCKLVALHCQRNLVSVEVCVDMLWSNRRLSHVSCSSPIDEAFAQILSEVFGVCANSVTFWINCMKSSNFALVGFLQSFLLPNTIFSAENTVSSPVTKEEVKRTASSLISAELCSSKSASTASYLLFDLSERLILEGRLFEALLHARESLRLRKKILQMKFVSAGRQPRKAESMWTNESSFNEALGSLITEDWPSFTKHQHSEDHSITPWSSLRCYLQSILQVGIIYEIIGNGAEAEILFRLGKTISLSLGFPVFGFHFSCNLGQVYRKKQLLDLAENELEVARSSLMEIRGNISCQRCEAALETVIGLHSGDFFRSKFLCSSPVKCIESLSKALTEYRSAIENLNPAHNFTVKATDATKATDNSFSDYTRNGEMKEPKFMTRRTSRRKASDAKADLSQNFKRTSCHEPAQHKNGELREILVSNSTESHLLKDIIVAQWQCHVRLFSLKLLSKMGKCMRVNGGIHEMHEVFWQSMSMLFDPGHAPKTGGRDLHFLEFFGMENSISIFPVQRAVLLYEMSLFCVKDCFSEGSRNKCCALSKPQIWNVLSWLFTGFILAQEVPLLFQKICRLIAAVISLSASTGHLSLPFSLKSLTETHLAAFFHQASIGANLQHLYVSNVKDMDIKGKNSTKSVLDLQTNIRPLERVSDLEKFIHASFNNLPSFPVLCISLLGGDFVNLLGETLLLPSFYPAWLLLSRLDRNKQPIVMLLPVDFFREEIQDSSIGDQKYSTTKENLITRWECPWGHTLVDYVVPQYRIMLEENYMSLLQTSCNDLDTPKNRVIWWSERSRLDKKLDMFLRRMEDLWLGPWKCLFLGERDDKDLEPLLVKLKSSLESECNLEASTDLLRVVVSGSSSVCNVEACISQMVQYKGYLGRGMCCGTESFRIFSSGTDEASDTISDSIRSLILETSNSTLQEAVQREPIVLVLDSDLQMLPWESLPSLRKEEVYRMPSMGSISATLARNVRREESNKIAAFIPSINPLDAYYLLNPSGDLSTTQMEFEEWFRSKKWEGKAGKVPTQEELADALRNHDLFLYFGHGSGTQYISGSTIQRLDHCSATLLMGCSSGSLVLRGNYTPAGAPLSYLLAGSPAVIANLWEVSDKDIDRFGKAMLTSWLQEANSPNHHTLSSDNNRDLSQEIEAPRRTRRKAAKDGAVVSKPDSREDASKTGSYTRVASFMSQARAVCKLPQLIGAAPVCYGVPTLIRRNQKP
ncbi:separase isoform X2 [Wolffia australiana]